MGTGDARGIRGRASAAGEEAQGLGREIPTLAKEDAKVEAAVLQHLLALHPTQLGFDELLRELGVGSEDFEQRDAVERAVRELTAAGLARRSGELVLPTRAALRLDQLLG